MPGDADRLFVGGKVLTASRNRPSARALAVRGDRILAVGTDAQAERWAGPRTRRVELRGRVLLPGFIDAHAHIADAAGELGWTPLESVPSLDAAVDALRAAAPKVAPGTWVVGKDWDESKWPERRYLTRDDLDRVAMDRPVFAMRRDRHLGSANSRALELAADLARVRGFETDGAGRPTGVLREESFTAVRSRAEASEPTVEAGLSGMARRLHRLGITSAHDVVGLRGWRAYQRAHQAGRLRLRVCAMPRDDLLPSLVGAGMVTGFGDAWLRLGAVKVFADGSLGAYTAALRESYVGRPEDRGILIHPQAELVDLLRTAHRAGLQTATHALGDDAIHRTLDALAAVQAEAPRRDPRHRIEHYELPDEVALRRTRDLGVLVCAQPNFIGQWSGPADVYETRLGTERASGNNPYRRILRSRVRLCFGSDGMPYGPLYGLHWAVNGFHPDQRIRVEEAIRAYTIGGAYASFEERLKGSLEPGKLADFVILEGDPTEEPDRIAGMRVAETWIGGTRVWRIGAKR